MGQVHMVIFVLGFLVIWVILFFERSILFILSKAMECCTKKPRRPRYMIERHPNPQEETPGGPGFTPGRPLSPTQSMAAGKDGHSKYTPQFVYADDVYQEFNFKQLYNEYKKLKQEKQRLFAHKAKSRFTAL